MSAKLINDSTLTAIGDAIREKSGKTDTYTPLEMPAAIKNIPSGGDELGMQILTDTFPAEWTFPSGVSVLNNYILYGMSSLKTVILPEGVTTIMNKSFGDSGLTNLVCPDSLTTLWIASFENCKIENFITPKNVKEIPMDCFMKCPLKRFEFSEAIETVNSNVFAYPYSQYSDNTADNLKIIFKSTPKKIAEDAFTNYKKHWQIYVPWAEGAVANAPWGATNATIHYNHTGEVA